MINWIDIPGETGPTLTKIVGPSDTGQYRRLDTNIAGSTPSNAADVVVQSGIYVQGGGIVYPAKTLSSTEAGQWYVDDVAVSGQVGSTYVISVRDIGKAIRCDNSNTLTCWHPRDVPSVKSVRVPWEGALHTVGPDAPATNGQTVRQWVDIVNGWVAENTNVNGQPILRLTGGVYSMEFPGRLSLTGDELDTFRNVSAGYIIAAARDNVPDAGANRHMIMTLSRGATNSSRIALMTFRLDITPQGPQAEATIPEETGPFRSAGADIVSDDPHVFTGLANWDGRTNSISVDGIVEATTSPNYNSGNTLDTASISGYIGNADNVAYPFNGDIFCLITASDEILSPAELSRLERFAMLSMGHHYIGPDIPLVGE